MSREKFNNKYNWCYSKNDKPFSSLPTNEQMVLDVISRTDSEGFFRDVLEWLRVAAPRKVRVFLKRLCPAGRCKVTHNDLCEAVCYFGFRANKVIENRMILGPDNEWTRMYFKDFSL